MIEKIKEKFLNKQFLTFGFIGGFNTLLSLGLSILLINPISVVVGDVIAGAISSFCADSISMISSYFLNMKFTYHEKPSLKSALVFPLSYLPGMIIAAIITSTVIYLGVPNNFAKLVSLPITIPVNYICMSLIVKLTKKKETIADEN